MAVTFVAGDKFDGLVKLSLGALFLFVFRFLVLIYLNTYRGRIKLECCPSLL